MSRDLPRTLTAHRVAMRSSAMPQALYLDMKANDHGYNVGLLFGTYTGNFYQVPPHQCRVFASSALAGSTGH